MTRLPVPSRRPAARACLTLAACCALAGPLGAAAATPPDTTPPELLSFRLPATVYPAQRLAPLEARFTLRDDLVGVASLKASLRGPDGQQLELEWSTARAPLVVAGYTQWQPEPTSAPGTWRVSRVVVRDLNRNARTYSGAELAAAGMDSTVQFVNRRADARAPQLQSGTVLTPSISHAARLPGGRADSPYTHEPARLSLRALDRGDGGTAGIAAATATYCEEAGQPWPQCFDLVSDTQSVPGKQFDGVLGGVPRNPIKDAPLPSGRYALCRLRLTDAALNSALWSSPACGGTTDFGTYFPAGSAITVTP